MEACIIGHRGRQQKCVPNGAVEQMEVLLCNTYSFCKIFRGECPQILPAERNVPLLIWVKPAQELIRLLFPTPEAPISATRSPCRMRRLA